jgi:hypothetical protein
MDKETIMIKQPAQSKNLRPNLSTSDTVTADVIIINTELTTLALPDQPAASNNIVA